MVYTEPKHVTEIKSMYIINKYCALSWYKYKTFTKKRMQGMENFKLNYKDLNSLWKNILSL